MTVWILVRQSIQKGIHKHTNERFEATKCNAITFYENEKNGLFYWIWKFHIDDAIELVPAFYFGLCDFCQCLSYIHWLTAVIGAWVARKCNVLMHLKWIHFILVESKWIWINWMNLKSDSRAQGLKWLFFGNYIHFQALDSSSFGLNTYYTYHK